MDEKVITKTLPDGTDLTVVLRPQAGGWYAVTEVHATAGPSAVITAAGLRQISMVNLEAEANPERPDLGDLPPLRRSPGMQPEEFSKLFVDHYKAWKSVTAHPIAAMRDAYEIRQPTLHTWLREARLRGLLPPGRVYRRG